MPYLRDPEAWSRSDGTAPRVLVEYADYGVAFAAERILQRQGYSVAVCGGPEHLRDHRCPLVTGGTCPLVDRADVVVNGLGLECSEHRAVLEAIRRTRPETRVVVEVTEVVGARHRELLDGCELVSFPMRSTVLVQAVEHALDSH